MQKSPVRNHLPGYKIVPPIFVLTTVWVEFEHDSQFREAFVDLLGDLSSVY